LKRKFEANPFSPPSVKDCQAEVGEEVLNTLIANKDLIQVSQDVILRWSDYETMIQKIKETILAQDQISLAEVRDLFNTSRKYAQAVLEHLDATGITVRAGDFRKLRKP
jgi:selenocysteine-specific elongation factor